MMIIIQNIFTVAKLSGIAVLVVVGVVRIIQGHTGSFQSGNITTTTTLVQHQLQLNRGWFDKIIASDTITPHTTHTLTSVGSTFL